MTEIVIALSIWFEVLFDWYFIIMYTRVRGRCVEFVAIECKKISEDSKAVAIVASLVVL